LQAFVRGARTGSFNRQLGAVALQDLPPNVRMFLTFGFLFSGSGSWRGL
jgi:hypothetical protein